jgi:CRP-like cAMP-binding protein
LAAKERSGAGDKLTQNEILAGLPASELEQLSPSLEYQEFSQHSVLYDPEKTIKSGYFLTSGMASCVIPTSSGRSVEVSLVGSAGFIGTPLIFGMERSLLRIVVQVPGDGYRIRAQEFQRLLPNAPHLSRLVGRYALLQGMQAAQTAACNRFHGLEQRLARWLLMMHDRVGPQFSMTQEYLAQLLGTGRPSVSIVASQMQRSGVIQYTRGQMEVIDRRALEKLACECYMALQEFVSASGSY